MQLADFINKKIVVCLKGEDEQPRSVTLLGVEPGGIWIDAPEITSAIDVKGSPDPLCATPAYFFPYERLLMVAAEKLTPGSADSPGNSHSVPRESRSDAAAKNA